MKRLPGGIPVAQEDACAFDLLPASAVETLQAAVGNNGVEGFNGRAVPSLLHSAFSMVLRWLRTVPTEPPPPVAAARPGSGEGGLKEISYGGLVVVLARQEPTELQAADKLVD
eukprot:15464195-Alexandrium_andersonii.AAC.1